MTSRCLYCDKRLSLFHGKKKPFCSDAHEDLYTERQALSGLDRLRDNYLEAGPSTLGRTFLPPAPSPAKPPEQFAYPQLEPGFFDDEPVAENPTPAGIFNRPPQRPADGIPPPADYLISGADTVQPAAPGIAFRNPDRAAFPPFAWVTTTPLEFTRAWRSPAPAQTAPAVPASPPPVPPPLVTSLERLPMPLLVQANLLVNLDTSKISALPDLPHPSSLPRLETQPLAVETESGSGRREPPPMVATFAPIQTVSLRLADVDTPRTFRDFTLDVAIPGLVHPPRFRTLKFETEAEIKDAPATILSPQAWQADPLPQPQPLRLRTMLDLRGSAFCSASRSLAAAPLAPLSWNASPPETMLWPIAMVRRRLGPVLPGLTIIPPAEVNI